MSDESPAEELTVTFWIEGTSGDEWCELTERIPVTLKRVADGSYRSGKFEIYGLVTGKARNVLVDLGTFVFRGLVSREPCNGLQLDDLCVMGKCLSRLEIDQLRIERKPWPVVSAGGVER
jgi:hypothetical protein